MKKSKDLCVGCYDDFYNGKNALGVSECWGYKNAEVCEKKFVPMDMVPPWDVPIETTLRCNRRTGYLSVPPEVMR